MKLRIALVRTVVPVVLCASIGGLAGCARHRAATVQPLPAARVEPTPPQAASQPAATAEPATQPAAPRADASEPAPAPETAQVQTHVVVAGDTLSALAQQYYGKASKWEIIFDANKDKLSRPDRLKVGMKLVIPPLEQPQQ
jgi:nucleoid-associated protein YgaU